MLSRNVELRKMLAATLVAAAAGAVAAPSALAGNLFDTIGITNTVPRRGRTAQINGGWSFRRPSEMPASNYASLDLAAGHPGRRAVPDAGHDRRRARTWPAFRGQPFTIKADSRRPTRGCTGSARPPTARGGGDVTLRFADGTTRDGHGQLPGLVRQPDGRPSHIAIGRFPGRNRPGGAGRRDVRDLPRHVDDLRRQRRQDARHDRHAAGTNNNPTGDARPT